MGNIDVCSFVFYRTTPYDKPIPHLKILTAAQKTKFYSSLKVTAILNIKLGLNEHQDVV